MKKNWLSWGDGGLITESAGTPDEVAACKLWEQRALAMAKLLF
jgi:hypothetical protein